MKCDVCGNKIPLGENRCPSCGAKIQVEHKHNVKSDKIQHSPKVDASGHVVQSKVTKDGKVLSNALDEGKNFFKDVAEANDIDLSFFKKLNLNFSDVIAYIIIAIAVILFIFW